jgi:hypothetical protein
MTTYFTPEACGAIGDGVNDDTAAWQWMLDSLPPEGGTVLAAGVYKVGKLNVTTPVKLEFQGGVSNISARLIARDEHDAVLNVTSQGFSAQGLVITSDQPNQPRRSGAFVRLENAPFFSITNFDFRAPYIGIELINSSIGRICHGNIRNTTKSSVSAGSAGIVIGNPAGDVGADKSLCVAVVIDDVVMDTDLAPAAPPARPAAGDMPSYGILIAYADAVIIANCDIIRAGRDLAFMPNNGQVVANTYVHHSYFDTALYGVILEPLAGGHVTQTWLTNVWTGSHGEHGVVLTGAGEILGFHAIRHQAVLNEHNGVFIDANAKDTWIDYGGFAQNGGSAIWVAPGTQRFKIRGNRIGPHDSFSANAAGIYLSPGCGAYEIRDNDLTFNTGAGLSDNALAATGYVTRNLGYATRTSGSDNVPAGSTSVTINHGLATIPPVTGLSVTPVSGWTTVSSYWIDSASITATTFTIRVNVAPSSAMFFAWQATTEKD